MGDKIVPRMPGEDMLDFGARVAKALGLQVLEVRRCGQGFAVVLQRELTLDEIFALSRSGIGYQVVLEFKE